MEYDYKQLCAVNAVIEFMHELDIYGLKDSHKLHDLNIRDAVTCLEVIRKEILKNI